jgi:hypothetical protein
MRLPSSSQQGDVNKVNVTIYLPGDVLERCRAEAVEENRSLSNYIAGVLVRALKQPADICAKCGHQMSSVAHSKQCGRQIDIVDAISAAKPAKHK